MKPFFQKIRQKDNVKVMLIGDSHTRGNYFPQTVGRTLRSYFNAKEDSLLSFSYYGINGAWARRFYEADMIQKVVNERPDLVIICFGTNEAHGAGYNEAVHNETYNTLTLRINERLPETRFLLTTPPGSYISQRTGSYTTGRGRRRRTHYNTVQVRNERTQRVSANIVNYATDHHIPVWDCYAIAGGPLYACANWRASNLMAADGVHFNANGYILQGRMLAEAIIKEFEDTAPTITRSHPTTPMEQQPYSTVQGN